MGHVVFIWRKPLGAGGTQGVSLANTQTWFTGLTVEVLKGSIGRSYVDST